MAKITTFSVEVVRNSETLYFRQSNLVISYVPLEEASSTADFAELGRWVEIVENEGSLTSHQNVEIELKASAANVDGDINDATEAEGLSKLTQLEKDALGL